MYNHPIYKDYYIDNEFNVYGIRKKLTPTTNNLGYSVISVYSGVKGSRKRTQYRVHRFIYECYYNIIISDDKVINHIDGDKSNNHLDNLELVSPKENTQHAFRIGLMVGYSGEDNSMAKLSNIKAANLIRELQVGLSNSELGAKYNLHPRYVSLIRHRRRWKKLWQELEGSETIS